MPWLFPDSLRLESDTFSGLAVRRWLLVKTGFCLPRLWERSRSRRLWKRQIALIAFAPFPVRSWKGWTRNLLKLGCEKTLKNNTGPFFLSWGLKSSWCVHNSCSQNILAHPWQLIRKLCFLMYFSGCISTEHLSVTGQGHREEKIMEGQG